MSNTGTHGTAEHILNLGHLISKFSMFAGFLLLLRAVTIILGSGPTIGFWGDWLAYDLIASIYLFLLGTLTYNVNHESKSLSTLIGKTMPSKILFILKRREVTDPITGVYSHGGLSSGLLNSARMIKEMLDMFGIGGKTCETKLVQVIDNNDIDREVTLFKPDIVIIEAIWVVPEKFDVLNKLHPNVKWIIRNHSNIPFLAQEGMALEWLAAYTKMKNVFIASNTIVSVDDLKDLVVQSALEDTIKDKVKYFPNFYVPHVDPSWSLIEKDTIDVGCFGAIRPLKNHLVQAIAAIRFAMKHGKHLNFHINSSRVEGGGQPILKNLRGLFKDSKFATLIEHEWTPHDEFVQVIAKMDIAVQVSFSETFNIVTADAVTMGVPCVVSPEVFWVSSRYHADPTSADDIVKKMEVALKDAVIDGQVTNKIGLEQYNNRSHMAISKTLLSVMSD